MVHSETYLPDTSLPTTTLYFNGPQYTGEGYDWITSQTSIVLTADDQVAGVEVTKYWIDDGQKQNYYGPFTIGTEGIHTIHYYSKDKVNYAEEAQIQTVVVDNTAPEATLGLSGTTYDDGTTMWLTDETEIGLPATDTGCGVQTIYYRVDEGAWMDYDTVFTLDKGYHTVEFYAEDHLGNTGGVQELVVGVDTEAPAISFTAPSENHLYIAGREIIRLPVRGQSVVLGSLRIDVGAQDTCGVSQMELYIDGELRYMERDDHLQWLWDEKAWLSHTIEVVAYDNLGQTSSKTLDVTIFNL
jgi:hypothetical protein